MNQLVPVEEVSYIYKYYYFHTKIETASLKLAVYNNVVCIATSVSGSSL